MIRRFATLLMLALLLGAAAFTQETPAPPQPTPQPPTAQQPAAGQENPEEESSSRRKARAHEYRKWTFNLGGGANLPSGTTRTYVKGGGGVAAVGAARNFSKYFGFRLDFMWANLPLRTSALQLA